VRLILKRSNFLLTVVFIVLFVLFGRYHTRALDRLDTYYSDRALEQEMAFAMLADRNADLVKVIDVLSDSKPMIFTAYNAMPWQTDDTPNITASNKEIYPGVLALSREMLKPYGHGGEIHYGDTVLVMLELIVEDTMHERWLSRGDVYMVEYADAINFGRKKGYLYHESDG
jgi:3D (Asp-Asp-Asp) domain-containing protein